MRASKAVADLEKRILDALREVEGCNCGATSFWAGELAREIAQPGWLKRKREHGGVYVPTWPVTTTSAR